VGRPLGALLIQSSIPRQQTVKIRHSLHYGSGGRLILWLRLGHPLAEANVLWRGLQPASGHLHHGWTGIPTALCERLP
jgi:hypothetical protein